MKKLFTTLLVIFSVTLCKAQWVTIPDANFRNWLNTHGYSSCMNGTMMDTTCSAVVNATSIDCPSNNILDLNGIQFFNSLTLLSCSYNHLISLPPLPNQLIYLYCYANQLTSLPVLPSTLKYIWVWGNQLASLPVLPSSLLNLQVNSNSLTSLPPLPNSITLLRCAYNQLSNLPSLPNSLNNFDCSNNILTSIPALSNSLIYLRCNNNQLTNLPSLPNSITTFNCSYNQLTFLPPLSNSLYYIDCSNNQLSALPAIPNSLSQLLCSNNFLISIPSLPNSLEYLQFSQNQVTSLTAIPYYLIKLECSRNQLTSLPLLPNSLNYLRCEWNQLTGLPVLPDSLYYLNCGNNLISSLPLLPSILSEFKIDSNSNLTCVPIIQNYIGYDSDIDISNTGITCLPNLIQHTGYIAAIDTMPICTCVYPSGVTVSNITATSAKVSWNAECCSEYRIQYRVTGTATWTTKIVVPPLTNKTLVSLTPGTTYDLKMKVKCTDGTTFSSWSPVQTFTTTMSCNPPTNLSATNLSQTQATINWSTVTGAYSYKLVRRKLGTTAWTTSTILAPLTSKILTGLTNNTTYQYRLQTICNVSGTPTSAWTPINTFTTLLRLEDAQSVTASSFSVNPNPCTTCEITGVENANDLTVTDIIGREITASFSKSANGYYINLSETASGVFIIRNINTGEVVKFVKE